jgi:putative transposase
MPWKECHVMDERLRFVARLLEGETMVALCEEFGILPKTVHKSISATGRFGVQGLHRPQPPAASSRESICRWSSRRRSCRIKREYPSWGAPKIRGGGSGKRCPGSTVPPRT